MLTRLGVKLIEIKSFSLQEFQTNLVGALQKCEGSNTLRSAQAIVDAVDTHDFGLLIQMLGRINFSVNSQVRLNFETLTIFLILIYSQSEARGRMIIDQWLLESIDISSTLPKSSRSILIPEFQISQLKKSPAKIVYLDQATYITGSTDYALWSVARDSHKGHDRMFEFGL